MANEKEEKKGWGVENIPNPTGTALVEARWDLCVGCGACELACSMFHYGVMDRNLSRVRIFRYILPLPKSVQNICAQCSAEERECQKACPVDPPVIHYNEKEQHMEVDVDRCLGVSCSACQVACPAKVPHFAPPEHDHPMVCDLCFKDGKRQPQCVEICPAYALEFMAPQFPQHLQRIHPDDKAESLSKRFYPLAKDQLQRPPEEVWKEVD